MKISELQKKLETLQKEARADLKGDDKDYAQGVVDGLEEALKMVRYYQRQGTEDAGAEPKPGAELR